MRVECPECFTNAHIKTRKKLSSEVTDLYCACANVECGHTFVATLAFKYTINPSRQSTLKMIAALIQSIPDHEKKQLLSELKIPMN